MKTDYTNTIFVKKENDQLTLLLVATRPVFHFRPSWINNRHPLFFATVPQNRNRTRKTNYVKRRAKHSRTHRNEGNTGRNNFFRENLLKKRKYRDAGPSSSFYRLQVRIQTIEIDIRKSWPPVARKNHYNRYWFFKQNHNTIAHRKGITWKLTQNTREHKVKTTRTIKFSEKKLSAGIQVFVCWFTPVTNCWNSWNLVANCCWFSLL